MASSYHMAAVRDLLVKALTDEELHDLAYGYFRPAFDQFTTGQTRGHRVQLLMETCERRGEIERLLGLVREVNPACYAEFVPRLQDANYEDMATQQNQPAVLAGRSGIATAAVFTERFAAITAQHIRPERTQIRVLGSLDRPEVAELRDALSNGGAAILIGEGGSGKSGILAKVAIEMQRDGHPVLLISADSFPRSMHNLQDLDALLQLGMPIFDGLRLLVEEGRAPVMIWDQLDSAAGTDLSRLLCTFMQRVSAVLPGVMLLASSRSFEAEHHVFDNLH